MNRQWWAVIILITGSLLATGCDSEAIKPLTDDEKDNMTAIALAHPEVAKWLEATDVYSTEVGWAAVGWNDAEATGWSRLKYEEIAGGNLPADRVFPSAVVTINPDVHISIGEPAGLHIHACFDRETAEVVAVQLMPGRGSPGPAPAENETHPRGMESPRRLSDAEKEAMVEIALNTPEASAARENLPLNQTGLGWVAISWDGSNASHIYGFDYEKVGDVPDRAPESAEIYSRVELYFGEPERLLLRVAVNPDTGEVAHVESHPLKSIPK